MPPGDRLFAIIDEMVESALRDRVVDLVDQAAQRIEARVADIELGAVSRAEQRMEASATFRETLERQIPKIEKELLDRCLVQSERLLAGQVEQWTLLFSDRVQEALQTASLRVQASVEEAASRHAAALDAGSEESAPQPRSRLEQQMAEIATQTRESFLRDLATELSKNQDTWLEKVHRQLDDLAEEHLRRIRWNAALVMKNLGESLLRQASLEGVSPAQISPAPAAGHETQATPNLSEAPVVKQDRS
jgi:hypothetical protein